MALKNFVKVLVALALTRTITAESVIVPGAAWTDTSGNIIQAHGAGIFKVWEILLSLRILL